MLLEASDGTKEDVIEIWNDFCDSARLAEVKSILKNYKDVDDKANKALKSSPVFKSKKQKMADQIADIEATINGL